MRFSLSLVEPSGAIMTLTGAPPGRPWWFTPIAAASQPQYDVIISSEFGSPLVFKEVTPPLLPLAPSLS